MKKVKNILNSKLFKIGISSAISLFAVLSIAFGTYSQKKVAYSFTLSKYDNNDKIIINNVKYNGTMLDLEGFKNKRLRYNKKEKELYCNKDCTNNTTILTMKTNISNNINVTFLNNNKSNYNVVVSKNNEVIDNINIKEKNGEYHYENINRTSTVIINYFKDLSVATILLYVLLFIVLCGFNYFSVNYIYSFTKKLKENEKLNIVNWIISFILLFLINLQYLYLLFQFLSYFALVPMLLTLVLSIFYLSKNKISDISKYFILVITYIGILFILLFPPLHIPDETSHFVNSYQKSFVFQDNNESTDEIGRKGFAHLPKEVRSFIIKYGSFTTDNEYILEPRTYLVDLFDLTNYKKLSNKVVWYGVKFSSPIPYLTGTFVSLIARLIGAPILLLYLLGKLFTIIIGSIMCYYALKITPKFKKIFFIVPLLPMFFQEAGGYCMDWLTNSTFILTFAYLLKLIYEKEKIERKQIITIVLLFLLLAFCKFGYFPIALLLLLVPNKKFSSDNKWKVLIKKILLILLPIIMGVLINYIVRQLSYLPNNPNSREVIPISMLFSKPFMIVQMLINTFKLRLDLDFVRGMVTGFGWYTIWLDDLSLFICMTLLVFVILCDDKYNIKLDFKKRIVLLIMFIMMCGIIYGAMLFGWTIVGSESIDGLQPRYFIPVIMVLYILLQNKIVFVKFKNMNVYYSITMIIINALALVAIIKGFYA